MEQTPGKRDFKQFLNPASLDELYNIILSLCKTRQLTHSLCLTGGEPLLQVDFLKNFLPKIQSERINIYLETNGALPKYLEEIIDHVDIISMDIKIASASGGSFSLKENKEFLEVAQSKEVFVKIVVVPETNIKEIEEASRLIASINPDIPLVIQPATLTHKIKHRPQASDLLAWQAVAKRNLKNVRIIPQIHKMLGFM